MSPTHEPIRQLEPANLLEPLDLSDEQAGIDWRAPEVPAAPAARNGTRSIPSAHRFARLSGPKRFVRPALVGSGLLILCFAAGAALPNLADLTLPASQRTAKAPPARPDAADRSSAGNACDRKAWPNLDRECMKDSAAANGDPVPRRVVTSDRTTDGSPR